MDHPAAWHPDPTGLHDHRWWDGTRWTEHVADAGVSSIDPLPPAPGTESGPAETADPVPGGWAGSAAPDAADRSVDPSVTGGDPAPAAGDHPWDAGSAPGSAEPVTPDRVEPAEPEPTTPDPVDAGPEAGGHLADEPSPGSSAQAGGEAERPDAGLGGPPTAPAVDAAPPQGVFADPTPEPTPDPTPEPASDPTPEPTPEPASPEQAAPEPAAADLTTPAAPFDPVSPTDADRTTPLEPTPDPTTPVPSANQWSGAPAPTAETPAVASGWGDTTAAQPAAGGWGGGDDGRRMASGGPTWSPQERPASSGSSGPSGMAAAAVVVGAVALAVSAFHPFLVPVGAIVAVVAIVLGIVGLQRAKAGTGGSRGLALGGAVVGGVALVASVFFAVWYAQIRGELTDCIERTGNEQGCEEALDEALVDVLNVRLWVGL